MTTNHLPQHLINYEFQENCIQPYHGYRVYRS